MKPTPQALIERYQQHLYAIAFNIYKNQQDFVLQKSIHRYHA